MKRPDDIRLPAARHFHPTFAAATITSVRCSREIGAMMTLREPVAGKLQIVIDVSLKVPGVERVSSADDNPSLHSPAGFA
jgi:hypothetical protein